MFHPWSQISAESCQNLSPKGSNYHVTYSVLCASDQQSELSAPKGGEFSHLQIFRKHGMNTFLRNAYITSYCIYQ